MIGLCMNSVPSRTSYREATLLGLSLRHYRMEIRAHMIRYKQLVIAGVLLLLPSGFVFKTLVFAPLTGIFAASGTSGAAWAAGLFVAATALWAGLQRDAVAYPPVAAFTASLPLSRGSLVYRDLAAFSLASSPLLLLIIATFVAARPWHSPGQSMLALTGILLASYVAQLAAARSMFVWAAAAILSAAAIGAVKPGPVLALLTGLNALLLWRVPQGAPWRAGDYRRSRHETTTRRQTPPIGWIGLHWRSLYQATQGAYRLTLFTTIALTALATAALHAGADKPMRNCGLLLVHGALITGLYGMGFATLFKNQSAYDTLLQSLPAGRLRRSVDMILAVELPAVGLVALLAVSSLALEAGPRIAAVALAVTVALCGVQYLIYRYSPRHTVAASLVVGIVAIVIPLQLAPCLGIQP